VDRFIMCDCRGCNGCGAAATNAANLASVASSSLTPAPMTPAPTIPITPSPTVAAASGETPAPTEDTWITVKSEMLSSTIGTAESIDAQCPSGYKLAGCGCSSLWSSGNSNFHHTTENSTCAYSQPVVQGTTVVGTTSSQLYNVVQLYDWATSCRATRVSDGTRRRAWKVNSDGTRCYDTRCYEGYTQAWARCFREEFADQLAAGLQGEKSKGTVDGIHPVAVVECQSQHGDFFATSCHCQSFQDHGSDGIELVSSQYCKGSRMVEGWKMENDQWLSLGPVCEAQPNPLALVSASRHVSASAICQKIVGASDYEAVDVFGVGLATAPCPQTKTLVSCSCVDCTSTDVVGDSCNAYGLASGDYLITAQAWCAHFATIQYEVTTTAAGSYRERADAMIHAYRAYLTVGITVVVTIYGIATWFLWRRLKKCLPDIVWAYRKKISLGAMAATVLFAWYMGTQVGVDENADEGDDDSTWWGWPVFAPLLSCLLLQIVLRKFCPQVYDMVADVPEDDPVSFVTDEVFDEELDDDDAVGWVLVFRQTYPYMYQPGKWAMMTCNQASDNYAILDQLENLRRNGKFRFKLRWCRPNSTSDFEDQIWEQTSNPVTTTDGTVTGYSSVNTPYTGEYWGGLAYNGKNCLLDGSVNNAHWFYAVGSFRPHNDAYPGPAKQGGASKVANYVELWVHTKDTIDFDTVPNYWAHKQQGSKETFDQMSLVPSSEHEPFDDIFKQSYKSIVTRDRSCPKPVAEQRCKSTAGGCPCVKEDGDPGLPKGYVVRRVIRVEDSTLWKQYVDRREEIKGQRVNQLPLQKFDPPLLTDSTVEKYADKAFAPLESDYNECYLWHGTYVRAALSIAQNDFNISKAGDNKGTMYGKGVYMAESCTKADEYATDDPRGFYEGVYAMVLCRVTMGKWFYTTKRDEDAGDNTTSGEYDSTLGDRAKSVGTFRELVVYDQRQVYPEYVVMYSRAYSGDNELAMQSLAQTEPLMTELPVYWMNVHLNPTSDHFSVRYKVRDSTTELIERLARGSAPDKGTSLRVTQVLRCESSETWTRYVSYKRSIKNRIEREAVTQKKEFHTGVKFTFTCVHSDTPSDDYVLFGQTEPLQQNVIGNIQLECAWRDQGKGSKKGHIMACLVRDGEVKVERDLFGACRADGREGMQTVHRTIYGDGSLIKRSREGDIIQFMYRVGVGADRALHIENFHGVIEYLDVVAVSRCGGCTCAVQSARFVAPGAIELKLLAESDGTTLPSAYDCQLGIGDLIIKATTVSFKERDPQARIVATVAFVNMNIGEGDNMVGSFMFGGDFPEQAVSIQPRRPLVQCKPPNELDGNPDSGHAITEKLLDTLDSTDCISVENLEPKLNEVLLWHGTSAESADAIVASGFRIPKEHEVAHGSRFGVGAYFAEDLDKSLSYCKSGSSGEYHVLLCRVTLGEIHYTEENWAQNAHTEAREASKDSVLANPEEGINGKKAAREFIVLEECQVYPEFILKIKLE